MREVDLSLSAGYLDAVGWLKSQLKRVGSSFSGEYDFRCRESLLCRCLIFDNSSIVVLADILEGGLSNPARVKRVVDKLSEAVLL